MNIIFEKYRSGINLGGWVSQCDLKKDHIANFIKKDDIERIASWGLDHVRLPFDYPILEDDSRPFVYKEEGFDVMHNLLQWCKDASLNLIFDMHVAPGYAFYNKTKDNILFSDETTQKHYISLWQEIAKRFKDEGDNLIFELLNEIVDAHGDTWNKIARNAIEAVRNIDKDRYILLGGPNYNSAAGLDTLDIYDDPHILYNFHFYEPFLFSHQRAVWTPLGKTGIDQKYPAKIEGIEKLKEYFGNQQVQGQRNELNADTIFDKAFMEERIAPAVSFAKRTGKNLYCGEYGAIDLAAIESRENYLRDINELFEKYEIGRALWSYKGMNFTSIKKDGGPISKKYIEALKIKQQN